MFCQDREVGIVQLLGDASTKGAILSIGELTVFHPSQCKQKPVSKKARMDLVENEEV